MVLPVKKKKRLISIQVKNESSVYTHDFVPSNKPFQNKMD